MENFVINEKIPILESNNGVWNGDSYYTDKFLVNGNWICLKSPGFENSQEAGIEGTDLILYKRENNNWILHSKIIPPHWLLTTWNDVESLSNYITIYKDLLIIIANKHIHSGNKHKGSTAYIYRRYTELYQNNWIRTGEIKSDSDTSFFNSSSIHQYYGVLGDYENNKIYIIKNNLSNFSKNTRHYDYWRITHTITNNNLNGFGYNVSIINNELAVNYLKETQLINENKIIMEGGICYYKKHLTNESWNKIENLSKIENNFHNTHIIDGKYSIFGDSTNVNTLNNVFNLIKESNSQSWSEIIPTFNEKKSAYIKFGENASENNSNIVMDNTLSNDMGNTLIFNDDIDSKWTITKDISDNSNFDNLGWSSTLESNHFILGNPTNSNNNNVTTAYYTEQTSESALSSLAKDELTKKYGIDKSVLRSINSIKIDLNVNLPEITISNEILQSILFNKNGEPDTKHNISIKRRLLLDLLFNNPSINKLKMTSSGIALDKTFEDVVASDKQIKQNVVVLKSDNINEPISLNNNDDLDDNTGLYLELNRLNQQIEFDIGDGNIVTISKIRDSSDNGQLELFRVSYNGINYDKEGGSQITILGKTFYIGSIYLDNEISASSIPQSGVFNLFFAKIRNDIHYLSDAISGSEANYINTISVNSKTESHMYYNSGSSNSFYINSIESPILHLIVGKKYRFDQEHPSNSNNLLKFYKDVNKTEPYEFNIIHNGIPGQPNSFTEISPDKNTPTILYYQSNSSDKMGNYFIVTTINQAITSIPSREKIHKIRHEVLDKLWIANPIVNKFTTNSLDLALDNTISKLVKKQVDVYKSKGLLIDFTNPETVNSKKGVYVDLNKINDYINIKTFIKQFKIKVTNENPKTYMIRNINDDRNLSEIRYKDNNWATIDGITFYFGGVYTSGTNDAITSADPYVFPINGNPYKLPDENANYCLYADDDTFITGTVSQLSKEKQQEMREWVINRLGSDTNNGASLVTDGFFYSNIHVNTSIGQLVLDMETKICNTNNISAFNVDFKNTRDNTYLFKGEHKATTTISWCIGNKKFAIDIDFFENPQIRNGIRMNTLMTKSNPIGLLVDDYEPSLLCVENSKNKLSMYNKLVNSLELGKRVKDDKLNLQKKGELWSRHKM